MSTLMDMLGGTIICAMIAIVIMQMNISFVTSNYNTNVAASAQESLVGIDSTTGRATAGFVQNLEYYFGKMGYNMDSLQIITTADTGSIAFKGDFYNTDSVRSVTFSTLPGSAYTNGGNANIKKWLYWYDGNGTNQTGRIPVSQYKLTYYDSLGRTLTPTPLSAANAAKVRSIRVLIQAESKTKMKVAADGNRALWGKMNIDSTFASVYWEKTFSPRNLRSIK